MDGDQPCISFLWDQQFSGQSNEVRNGEEEKKNREEEGAGEGKMKKKRDGGREAPPMALNACGADGDAI